MTYTSWLSLVGVIGLGFYIYSFIDSRGLNNNYVAFISIIVNIWSTFMFEKWKQKEVEHAYSWDMIGYKEQEPERFEFQGRYFSNSLTKRVEKKDKFPTTYRRLTVEPFFILFGVILIALSTALFRYVNNEISESFKRGEISEFDKSMYEVMAGSMNGGMIFVINLIYSFIARRLVLWENHKLESDLSNSLIMKNISFQFFSSYINIFIYAYYDQDFDLVASQYTSIMISKGILNILKVS